MPPHTVLFEAKWAHQAASLSGNHDALAKYFLSTEWGGLSVYGLRTTATEKGKSGWESPLPQAAAPAASPGGGPAGTSNAGKEHLQEPHPLEQGTCGPKA